MNYILRWGGGAGGGGEMTNSSDKDSGLTLPGSADERLKLGIFTPSIMFSGVLNYEERAN